MCYLWELFRGDHRIMHVCETRSSNVDISKHIYKLRWLRWELADATKIQCHQKNIKILKKYFWTVSKIKTSKHLKKQMSVQGHSSSVNMFCTEKHNFIIPNNFKNNVKIFRRKNLKNLYSIPWRPTSIMTVSWVRRFSLGCSDKEADVSANTRRNALNLCRQSLVHGI